METIAGMSATPAVVVGGGVIGLSCAIQMLESGRFAPVTCVADAFPPETTSDGSGALWRPAFLDGVPDELVDRWAQNTFDHLTGLMQELGPSPILHMCEGNELYTTEQEDPFWSATVHDFRHTSPDELRHFNEMREPTCDAPFVVGHHFKSVMMHPRNYLTYLMDRFKAGGGQCVQQKVSHLAPLHHAYGNRQNGAPAVVVNCSGLGAKELCGDSNMRPGRGQTVRLIAPCVTEFLVLFDGPYSLSYILPRAPPRGGVDDSGGAGGCGTGEVVLGGTHQEGDWGLENRAEEADRILDVCTRFVPGLAAPAVRASASPWAGLRPERAAAAGGVRLELDREVAGVVHCYGHGGSGMTLHWGCAAHVLELALACQQEGQQPPQVHHTANL
jgi:glycine/D-amino acid oxidase-like deaminating enzyme